MASYLMHTPTGDIADDKYFRKANDSDATQFSILYPKMGAHSTSDLSLSPSPLLNAWFSSSVNCAVWALLWIIFEVVVLTGFVLLGIACFKFDKDQMYAQAGESDSSPVHTALSDERTSRDFFFFFWFFWILSIYFLFHSLAEFLPS